MNGFTGKAIGVIEAMASSSWNKEFALASHSRPINPPEIQGRVTLQNIVPPFRSVFIALCGFLAAASIKAAKAPARYSIRVLLRIVTVALAMAGLGNAAHAGTTVSSTPIFSETGVLGYTSSAVSLSRAPTGTATTCTVTASGNLVVSGIPAGATVRRAILWWGTTVADPAITLAGTAVSAQQTYTDTLTIGSSQNYFGYRGNVTSIVSGNGTYAFSGLNTSTTVTFGGACLGGAMLMVIYDTAASDPTRLNRIDVFEGFQGIRGAGGATGGTNSSVTLPVNLTGTNRVIASTLAWQGNSTGENAIYTDSVTINGSAISGTNNPVNDANNGTGAGGAALSSYAVDFDTFNVTSIAANQTSLTFANASSNADYVLIQGFVVGATGVESSDALVSSYGLALHNQAGTLRLGSTIDHEILPASYAGSAAATSDDASQNDDEDGVTLPASFTVGQASVVPVAVTGTGGRLQAWIDWNNNNVFDAAEQVATNVTDGGAGDTDSAANSIIALSITPPGGTVAGNKIARFRWSTTSGLGTTALAADGEVEDYQVTVQLAATADLLITKTNTPGVNGNVDQASDSVNSGGTTTYTLTVINNGPDMVTGALVTDTPGSGLTCPATNAVTVAINGVPFGSFTVADLTGAGITLSALGNGESAVLSVTCNVQ